MHKILVAVWHMVTRDMPYQDLGPAYFHNQPGQIERRKRRLIEELGELGVGTSTLKATA